MPKYPAAKTRNRKTVERTGRNPDPVHNRVSLLPWLHCSSWIQYKYINTDTWEYVWDDNPDLTGENLQPVIEPNWVYNGDGTYSMDGEIHKSEKIGTKTIEVGLYDTKTTDLNGHEIEVKGQLNILKDKNFGTTIKNGTTKANAIEHYTIGYNAIFYENKGFAASYDQNKINDTAQKIAIWLNDNNFVSVQKAIENGSDSQLGEMLSIFKENMFTWSDVDYYSLSNNQDLETKGTTYINDGFWAGDIGNNSYTLHTTSSDLYSIINEYGGKDELYLDNSESGYSFLFDVEVDKNGKLLNYSRDFYVKYAGEEANETGIVINCGREKQHAIEKIYMGENQIFQYNETLVDLVRQDVAGWLSNNNYSSVQEVLQTNNTDIIAQMMAQFAPINNV